MDYPYANGIVKALENNLLDKSKLSKLIKLSQKDIIRSLKEMGYGKGSSSNHLEDLINEEIKATKKLYKEISPKTNLTDLFLLQYDALNIKVLWKAKLFNTSIKDLLNDYGSIDKDVLSNAILNGVYDDLLSHQAMLLKEIEKQVTKLDNPRLISVLIDSLVFDYSFKQIGIFTDKALINYLKASIDIINVLTLVRFIRLNWSSERYQEVFIKNGLIGLDVMLSVYNQFNEAGFKHLYEYYSEKITILLNAYLKNDNLGELETGLNRLLINVTKEFEYDTFGIGPLISYYLKKQTEARNIRLIYAHNDIELSQLMDF